MYIYPSYHNIYIMRVDKMSEKSIILEKLQKKEVEIQGLEDKLKAAKIYVQALQDVLNALGRDSGESAMDAALRPGSSVATARDVILKSGQPMHISDLLAALGKAVTKEGRASLASSLAAYVRRGEIFTRPAPNTFGLVELGHTHQSSGEQPHPPVGFGESNSSIVDMDDEIPFS
jgi:hypothetical protein